MAKRQEVRAEVVYMPAYAWYQTRKTSQELTPLSQRKQIHTSSSVAWQQPRNPTPVHKFFVCVSVCVCL